ncbi:MAG: right-handed parallel beta-helix repeat-containing protein [Clostridia bacterium]|nr:right-handed parallel beta-helix repeat-containing protein [Clostridia bacterium]
MNMIMTRIISVICAFFVWLNVIFVPSDVEGVFSESSPATEKSAFDEGDFVMGEFDIVVAPDGNDADDGTLENPLKTPAAAKERIKTVDTDKTVTVWFREGTYFIENSLDFTAEDKSNVVYRSYPDEKVVFSGAKEISGNWQKKTVNGVVAFVTDMPIESDTDYFRSLFKDGKRLSRSNYPKEGVFKIAAEPKPNEAVEGSHAPDFFTHALAFYVNTNEIFDFENPGDVDVRIMHFWRDDLLPIHSVNKETGRIETTKPSAMRIRTEDSFVYENVKEALSLPGEWYLDRNEGKLYYIPESGDTVENTVLYAGMNEQLITVKGAGNISFRGIDFENTDWDHVDGTHTGKAFDPSHPMYGNIKYGADHPQAAFEVPAAIYISESHGINFTDCRFENISYTAVKFDKASQNCNITSCMFNEIGANAVFIHGDFVVPATTCNINVKDCHISRYGRIFNNAIGILLTHAKDCDLTNNEIHDGWYTGVSVGWNWGYSDNSTNNINISNNVIYDIGNGWLSDMGAIYTLGIQPDTVIRGNIIYNVGCDEGRYGYGGWGIYLDEGSSGMLVENNLVYDCSSETFHQHYGKDNVVRNNIFAFGGEGALLVTKKEDHNSLTLTNNILVVDNALIYPFTPETNQFVDNNNLFWDYTKGGNVYSGNSLGFFEKMSLVIMTVLGYYNNAVFADPLFKDAQNRDFTLADNSPALETGFTPWVYNAGTVTQFG